MRALRLNHFRYTRQALPLKQPKDLGNKCCKEPKTLSPALAAAGQEVAQRANGLNLAVIAHSLPAPQTKTSPWHRSRGQQRLCQQWPGQHRSRRRLGRDESPLGRSSG